MKSKLGRATALAVMAELVPIGAELGRRKLKTALSVMTWLVPVIHVVERPKPRRLGPSAASGSSESELSRMDVDDRDKPGHDGSGALNVAHMGLVPAIHVAPRRIGRRLASVLAPRRLACVVGLGDVDGRDKPGHDGFVAERAA